LPARLGEAVVPAPRAECSIVVSKLMSSFDQSLSQLDIGVNPILNRPFRLLIVFLILIPARSNLLGNGIT
jgi:hypothetical protein